MEEKKTCPCCEERHKERSDKEYKDLIHRLNRMEGQIRGIKGMVERGVYCTDILVQVAAVNAALNSFNRVLLANHIKTCVTDDIRAGKEETVDELIATLQKLSRSKLRLQRPNRSKSKLSTLNRRKLLLPKPNL